MFLICAADESEWSASCLGHYVNEESEPSTHCIGWMGPRTVRGAQEEKKSLTHHGIESDSLIAQSIV